MFHTHFDDFVFLGPTGDIIDGLSEFAYLQDTARFMGTEISVERHLWRAHSWSLRSDATLEYVRAKTRHFGNLPRIPPLELTGGLNLVSDRVSSRVELVWTDRQNHTAAFETTTKGSSIINLSTSVQPLRMNEQLHLVFRLNNLTNAVHRTHASFLKDRVPAAGRSFSARLVMDF